MRENDLIWYFIGRMQREGAEGITRATSNNTWSGVSVPVDPIRKRSAQVSSPIGWIGCLFWVIQVPVGRKKWDLRWV